MCFFVIIYCLLDALGTFADSKVLETLNEDSANCAYELTFLLAAIVCFIYVVLIKKSPLVPKREAPKYAGAIFAAGGPGAGPAAAWTVMPAGLLRMRRSSSSQTRGSRGSRCREHR